jgi:hypothetical protein
LPNIAWRYEPDTGGNPYGARGGLVSAHGIQYLRMGGLARGTDTVPAMLTPGESVLTRRATERLGTDAIAELNRGSYWGGGGGEKTEIFIIKPDGTDPEAFWSALPERVKYNRRGLRTQLIEAFS